MSWCIRSIRAIPDKFAKINGIIEQAKRRSLQLSRTCSCDPSLMPRLTIHWPCASSPATGLRLWTKLCDFVTDLSGLSRCLLYWFVVGIPPRAVATFEGDLWRKGSAQINIIVLKYNFSNCYTWAFYIISEYMSSLWSANYKPVRLLTSKYKLMRDLQITNLRSFNSLEGIPLSQWNFLTETQDFLYNVWFNLIIKIILQRQIYRHLSIKF